MIEKNAHPGGRCDQIVRDGHRFDVGPSIFLMPEVFAETYRALGQRMEDHLDLRRVNPTYRIRFDDGSQITLNSDINLMQPQLEAIEPGSFNGYLRYLAKGNLKLQAVSLRIRRQPLQRAGLRQPRQSAAQYSVSRR